MTNRQCILLILSTICLFGICISLPTQRKIISNLLEISEASIDDVVKQFKFCTVPRENVKILLYSPSSNETTPITSYESLNLENPTKILIHGYTGSPHEPWIEEVASLYHQKGSYNVIALDWSEDASGSLLHAAAAVQDVGFILGEFILDAANHMPNFLQTLHVIAHSFGAQLTNFVAEKVATGDHGLMDRITALDAAAPLFETPVTLPASVRLDPNDASFVDLIHTSAGLNGVSGSYGKVDFFVNNGGPIQPGCESSDIDAAISCSHSFAHVVFRQSIKEPDKYKGVACENAYLFNLGVCIGNTEAFMGDGASRDVKGNFYVRTEPAVFEDIV